MDNQQNISELDRLVKENGYDYKNPFTFDTRTNRKDLSDIFKSAPGLFNKETAGNPAVITDNMMSQLQELAQKNGVASVTIGEGKDAQIFTVEASGRSAARDAFDDGDNDFNFAINGQQTTKDDFVTKLKEKAKVEIPKKVAALAVNKVKQRFQEAEQLIGAQDR